jgi:hypothetical protein
MSPLSCFLLQSVLPVFNKRIEFDMHPKSLVTECAVYRSQLRCVHISSKGDKGLHENIFRPRTSLYSSIKDRFCFGSQLPLFVAVTDIGYPYTRVMFACVTLNGSFKGCTRGVGISSSHLIPYSENTATGGVIRFAEHYPVQNGAYSVFYAQAILTPGVQAQENRVPWECPNVALKAFTKEARPVWTVQEV